MNPDDYHELRERLIAIESELRATREALERHAPAPPQKEVSPPRPNVDQITYEGDELKPFLSRPALAALPEAVDRFLVILGFLYQLHPEDFAKLEQIRGRKRIYISRSKLEIESSGRATHPRKIPRSPWFVFTNNSTRMKVDLLTKACRLLGHSVDDCIAVSRVIDPEVPPAIDMPSERRGDTPSEDDEDDSDLQI